MTDTVHQNTRRRSRTPWHFQPELPLTTSPYFAWPWRPARVVRWIVRSWFPASERLIILIFALVSAAFFHPTLDQCRDIAPGWVLQILARNAVLMCVVAGGLHWYFYIARKQGDDRRYDARPFPRGSRSFTFNAQVRDNMFWTLASGVTIWSGYEVLMMWALANGYAPATESWMWTALLIFLLPLWETTHFFLIHRLIHIPFLYRKVHSLHHRNTNVGPWSGLSMHPVEHLIYLSTVLIHFVIPSNPLLIIFHLQYFTLSAATTHCGYQGITRRGKILLPLGTYHHQLHHRFFECNYGGLEVPWDQWTGSFHDGTAAAHERFQHAQKARAKAESRRRQR